MIRPLLFCFFLGLSLVAVAQSYSVSGQVLDAKTGQPMASAAVAIEGTTLGTNTDEQGQFRIDDISSPRVTLVISYLGYRSYRQTLDLRSNATRSIRISMNESEFSLEEVTVRGQAGGTIQAMIEQKQAESIKNIISAEQIATFPDLNAAEVLQRIPGITLQRDQGEGRFVQLRGTPPELTTFQVNGEQIPSPEGNVRYVGLDIIPSDQIESIEVTKVLTPDMDADGIAGNVNIKTKEAAGPDPEVRLTLSGGYANIRQTPNYQAQFSYGQRYGKFGFHINSSYFRNERGSDNLEFDFVKGPFFGSQDAGRENFFVQYREVQLRHYDLVRTRIGVSPSMDLRFNENSRIYLQGMYNSFTDDETRRRLIYELDDAVSATFYLFGGVNHDVRERVKRQELSTLALGGEHRIGQATLDYQLFYAYARELEPDKLEAVFDSPGQAINIDFDLSDPDFPRATFPVPSNAVNATNYDEFELEELLFEDTEVTDQNFTPRVNLSIPFFLPGATDGYFKVGGKIRYKQKDRDIRALNLGAYFQTSNIYPGEGPPLSLTTVNDGFRDTDLLGEGYLLEFMPSPKLLRDFYESYPQFFIIDRTGTRVASFGEDYEAEEIIYAGYGMVRQDFGKLMLIGGVRMEHTDIDYVGRNILLDRGRFVGIDTLTDERTHTFVLPQFQARYALNEKINLRAGLTYSYSRPNFEDVIPYREQDREEVKFGNPNLDYPLSLNIDLLAERYYRRSILSGGVFYKNIQDFIFFFKRFAHECEDFSACPLVEITQAVNGISARVYGAELQAQFKFDFLPSFWSNFGIYTNYTYTYSEARIKERVSANFADAIVQFGEEELTVNTTTDAEETLPLPGQSPHAANLALFYDADRFFARLTANYQDDFLFQLGADPDLDEYFDSSLRLDFTTNYQITRHINVFADVLNIIDTPLRLYLGQEDLTQQSEYYSWWARVGFKLTY